MSKFKKGMPIVVIKNDEDVGLVGRMGHIECFRSERSIECVFQGWDQGWGDGNNHWMLWNDEIKPHKSYIAKQFL